MARYHINPETGRPNQCTAKVRCRFGTDTQHFDSKEEARAGYEKQMQNQTVSGSLKKSSLSVTEPAPAAQALFDPKAVEKANEEIERISNGAVTMRLASEFMGNDARELIIAFNAEHDMVLVIEEEDGKKVAYTAYGPDPTRNRWPIADYVTATRIDDLAMENENYRPGGWDMEPSKQGEQIARLINAVANKGIETKAAPQIPPAKKAPAVSTAPKPLAVIPGVPPVRTAQELDSEKGELEGEDLHGYTVKELLRARDITTREVEEAERRGDYVVWTKVPSYSEVAITTDLARRELGMISREKTGIDEDPLRIAEIAKDNAYSKTFGVFHTREESMAANQKYREAREEYYRIRDERDSSKK
jgi:hypothetical protein